MTDMYLNDLDRRRSRTGCFIMGGLAALILVGGVWFTLARRGTDADRDVVFVPATGDASPVPQAPVAEPVPTIPPGDPGRSLTEQAKEARARQDFSVARELGLRVLEESLDEAARSEAEAVLNEVHIELVMNPWPMPEKTDYTVKRNESLAVLAERFGTTVDLIQRSNRIADPNKIDLGQRLRIFSGEFSMEVSKTRCDLMLYMNGQFFKRYRVGTGEFASTPIGEFTIVHREAEPVWWTSGREIPYGHPDNLLGTHYLKLDIPGYGLHGTWEPETIGYQSSAGCVRLLNEEIQELYTLLPVGVRVRIVD